MDMWKILALSCVVVAGAEGSGGSTRAPFSSDTLNVSGPTQKLEKMGKKDARPLANDGDISNVVDTAPITEQTEDSFESPQSSPGGIQSRRSSDDTPEGKLRECCKVFNRATGADRRSAWGELVRQLAAYGGPLPAFSPTAEAVQEAAWKGLRDNLNWGDVSGVLAVAFPDLAEDCSSMAEWMQALEMEIRGLRCEYAMGFLAVLEQVPGYAYKPLKELYPSISNDTKNSLLWFMTRACGDEAELLSPLLTSPDTTEVQRAVLAWYWLKEPLAKDRPGEAPLTEMEAVLDSALELAFSDIPDEGGRWARLGEVFSSNAGY